MTASPLSPKLTTPAVVPFATPIARSSEPKEANVEPLTRNQGFDTSTFPLLTDTAVAQATILEESL